MRWKHWKPIAAVILLAVMLCVAAYAAQTAEADKSERQVTEAQVPAAALATLKKLAGGAKITEFAKEVDDGHTFYEGSWQARSGTNMDVRVTQAGDLLEIEEQVPADKVPAAVLKVATKVAGRGAQLVLEKTTTILYEVKFQEGDRQHELLLTPDGRRVEQEVGQGNSGEDEGDEDEDEEQVSIEEVPKAVKATILEHAKSGEIDKIERGSEDGQVIYEAEVTVAGKDVELKVAPSGKLLGKEVEEENDDDEENERED